MQNARFDTIPSSEPKDVIEDQERHEYEQEYHTDLLHGHTYPKGRFLPGDSFVNQEHQVPAVERRNGEYVHDGEGDREQRHDPPEYDRTRLGSLLRHLRDHDRPAHSFTEVFPSGKNALQTGNDRLRIDPGNRDPGKDGLSKRVGPVFHPKLPEQHGIVWQWPGNPKVIPVVIRSLLRDDLGFKHNMITPLANHPRTLSVPHARS